MEFGKAIGELRKLCEENIFTAQEKIEAISIKESLEKDQIDITLPGSFKSQGKLHPLTVTTLKITDFFSAQGYLIEDGPEIESDYYNFDALNIPLIILQEICMTLFIWIMEIYKNTYISVPSRAIEREGVSKDYGP